MNRLESIASVPPEIGRLTALITLYLHGNQLASLPPEIGRLTSLRALHLGGNQFASVPPELGQLSALTELYLGGNQLASLPPELGRLTSLRALHLNNNQLASVPPELGRLTSLRALHLNNNQLASVPPELGRLTALTELYLHENQLALLPPELGRLTALSELHLGGNQLASLPAEIGQLSALTVLHLYNNQLASLPPELGRLSALTELYLHANQALDIPISILGPTYFEVASTGNKAGARPQDLLNFYFRQREAAAAGTLRPVNEIKVMLVGRGGAGKTSLRRFFMNQPHDTGEKETPGIALDSFGLPCEQGTMKVRLWDFAGQEITHALHQFFLTEGCVYLLVIDPRSNTEMQDAEYWLGLLSRYAGGSAVLVVLNRQDARRGGYDVDRRMLRERFPFIHSFTPTNCERREGCDNLKRSLSEAVGSLKVTEPPHLQVPAEWLKVMTDCTGEAQGKSHITLDEFRGICAKHGEHESEKQESLARLLHKLGAVLHFVDEPRLRDTTVLNPHWVTDGVYRLLRFKDRPGSDGTLTLAEALEALPGEKEQDARFLLRLMERFEMCFTLDDQEGAGLPTRWLIPGALNEFQPEGVTSRDWQQPGGVRLRYLYDPLPEGVLPRFIVRTHLLSDGKPRWRNGVVLADGRASALVRRGAKRNHVEVTAFGPESERLRLLEIIQGNLERIHADLPDPKPYAELELAELPGVFRRMADLEAAELGRQKVAVQSGHEKLLVEPTPQLNRTSELEARRDERVPLHAFLSYSHKDKTAKGIFQDNLTVMAQKKFIMPWHDGLIEPGMRWKEEIQANLARMDLFIGLLTNPFLASEFVQEVEVTTARERLRKVDRDFLFVLILVDDISLQGLDLAEYQILRPGGKAVSRHKSRKEGFNVAQGELETLIRKRQAELMTRRGEDRRIQPRSESRTSEASGITTIIVHGDFVQGAKSMIDDHRIHIGGNVTNAQVGQTLTNCTNLIQQQAPGERKDLLETLQGQVQGLLKALPADKQDEALQVAENLEMLVKQVTSEKPNRKWYSVSADGLLEAATFVKDFSGEIAGTLRNLGKSLWPDFALPGAK